MFGIMIPPTQAKVIEEHYEHQSQYRTEKIAKQVLSDLLQQIVDAQYCPSKELAAIYFANNNISPWSKTSGDYVEMVKTYGKQLEIAYRAAVIDKLLIACRFMWSSIDKYSWFKYTKVLEQLLQYSYRENTVRETEYNIKTLWYEYQLEENKDENEQLKTREYDYRTKEAQTEFTVASRINPMDVKNHLVMLGHSLRGIRIEKDTKRIDMLAMHLLIMSKSFETNYETADISQRDYAYICKSVRKTDGWTCNSWDRTQDLDPTQVIMIRDLSGAASTVVRCEGATIKPGLQALLQWYILETSILTKLFEEHDDGPMCEAAPVSY